MKLIMNFKLWLGLLAVFYLLQASADVKNEAPRVFTTSFEAVEDFSGFYIVPQAYKNTSWHERSSEVVRSGKYSHKGWIKGENLPSTLFSNNNHRAYPTIQFQKTPKGVFKTPVDVELWVWLDMPLKARAGENEWFSFATFTNDKTDAWKRTVLVNLSVDGFVHLMHVPKQNMQVHIFQNNKIKFPQRQWVKLRIYLDFSDDGGYAKVWQDDVLVSHARVGGMGGILSQVHFGLYAAPSISSGVVYNDDLTIREVVSEPSENQSSVSN